MFEPARAQQLKGHRSNGQSAHLLRIQPSRAKPEISRTFPSGPTSVQIAEPRVDYIQA